MFEPAPLYPPSRPRLARASINRLSQAIQATVQREEVDTRNNETVSKQEVEKARIELEAEIKRKLEETSDEDEELYSQSRAKVTPRDTDKDLTDGALWQRVLLWLEKNYMDGVRDWRVVCLSSAISAVITVLMFWMELV